VSVIFVRLLIQPSLARGQLLQSGDVTTLRLFFALKTGSISEIAIYVCRDKKPACCRG